MKVFFINNNGGGFADTIDVPAAQTVAAFFEEKQPRSDPHDFLIRVNRLPVSADQILQENDRISISPTRIQGA